MYIVATVIQVNPSFLLVRDNRNGMEIRVIFGNARRFSRGDLVRITYNGQMTHSIPPQIFATSIERLPHPPQDQSRPAETRVTVVQVRRGALLVRDGNNRQLLVHFPYAHHFCARQRVVVRHDTITMGNPPEIHAIDISPVC